ncbi:hypothetical protein P9990_19870 [Prescottella equi]|uniref:hypothetical protein n=1 Tax=Rhodococcus hoagii TaxID=43767 RepID=UPI0025767A32|nr:hypothetical protein [Prescottella equi]WJJ10813.1 hypothetical protein P9990_19870 [Prescottella equi]
MAGIPQVTKTGPKTFTPAEVVLGGQLVEARAAGRIGVAAAGSVKVLGVALTDAQSPDAPQGGTTTDAIGRPIANAMGIPTCVAVAYGPVEVQVSYAAAANFGDRLIAAAGGKVTPAAVDADARTIVGICTEPAGVVANKSGLVRLA